jgi:2-dehydropantoate 2-reductase
MRFVVFGAGAIGGVIGGRLAQHGHDVVLLARGAHYEAIRDRGLTLEWADERLTLPVPVHDAPAAVGFRPDDVVVLGVKGQDTIGALDALAAAASPETPIVCAQNGVENERVALRRFANVYGMCVMCPATHLAPGVVQAYSAPVSGLLDIGRYPSGVDDTTMAVADALRASTFESEPRVDIMRWKYAKLLMNLANAVEALFARSDASAELASRARAEGDEVLRAAGIDFASTEEDRERRGDLLTWQPVGGARRGGGSSWQSLQRGTGAIEADYLNGEIVVLGRLHGVATPVNALLQRLANRAAREGRSPGTLDASDAVGALDALARVGQERSGV